MKKRMRYMEVFSYDGYAKNQKYQIDGKADETMMYKTDNGSVLIEAKMKRS